MSDLKPSSSGLPSYTVRPPNDGAWLFDSISGAIDFAARRVYMGPVEKVNLAIETLRKGEIYRYCYGSNEVEIEPSGPEIPPGYVAAAPELLKALKAAQSRLCEHCPQYMDAVSEQVGDHTDECLAAMEAIEKAEGEL
jgi:hypothetical protein